MGDSLCVDLAYPPSVNKAWRPARGGKGLALTKDAKKYRKDGVAAVMAAMLQGGVRPLVGRAFARVDLYPPDRIRRDVDNALKAILDVLKHAGAVADDELIDVLRVVRHEPVPGGLVVVTLRLCTPEDYAEDLT